MLHHNVIIDSGYEDDDLFSPHVGLQGRSGNVQSDLLTGGIHSPAFVVQHEGAGLVGAIGRSGHYHKFFPFAFTQI